MGATVYAAIDYARKRARELGRPACVWRLGEKVGVSSTPPEGAKVIGHADKHGDWHEAEAGN